MGHYLSHTLSPYTQTHTKMCNIMEAIDYETLGDILIMFSGNKNKCRLCMYADLKDV